MATDHSAKILEDLDHILAKSEWKGPPSDMSHLSTPLHLASFKQLGNQEQVISGRIASHVEKETGNVVRVCSIGCGDGSLDREILQSLKKAEVQYVGLDMDEQVVEEALENLSKLSSNVQAETEAVDYEEEDSLKELSLEPFDVIWMVNCTYYATSLNSMIKGAMELLKPSGTLLIVSSSQQSIEQLVTRFWFHQRQHHLHTTEDVLRALSELDFPHITSKEPVTFNLTEQLRDDFKSAASALVLDHLVFCRLSDYSPEVKRLVVAFLHSIADISETLIKIVSMSDLIQVTHPKKH